MAVNNETYIVRLREADKLRLNLNTQDKLQLNLTTPVGMASTATINGVRVQGDLTAEDLGLARASIHTRAEWSEISTYVPAEGEIVIYSDWNVIDGVTYPAVKIGDGNAYVVDLPIIAGGEDMAFIIELADMLTEHINNMAIHVSDEDRERWDNKLNYEVNESLETLVFNRE